MRKPYSAMSKASRTTMTAADTARTPNSHPGCSPRQQPTHAPALPPDRRCHSGGPAAARLTYPAGPLTSSRRRRRRRRAFAAMSHPAPSTAAATMAKQRASYHRRESAMAKESQLLTEGPRTPFVRGRLV